MLAGTVGERNDLGCSSLGYDIDRLELPGYRVDDRVVSVDITGRLATEAAMLLVSGADSDDTPVGGGLGYSDARRQGSLMVAITSPDDLDVDRKERSRHDVRCDLQGMPTSESPTMPAAPQSVSGVGSRGVPVGGVLSPDGALMPHSHETHLYAAASRPEALHVGGSVSQTRSGSPSSGAEPGWEWDRRAGMQEVLVPGNTAAQAISLTDGAPMSHSHETHLSAAASLREALNVGGSVLQTQPIVAAIRLRGGGGASDRRAQYRRAKERGSVEAAEGSGGKRRMEREPEVESDRLVQFRRAVEKKRKREEADKVERWKWNSDDLLSCTHRESLLGCSAHPNGGPRVRPGGGGSSWPAIDLPERWPNCAAHEGAATDPASHMTASNYPISC